MFKKIILSAAAMALTPLMASADVSTNYTSEELNFIEDALDNLVVPARVDVGVGIEPDDDVDRPGRQRVMCRARNFRGQTFDAVGYVPNRVERRAYMMCERRSRACRSLGCRRI